jgi:hypothetical protein
MATLDFSWLSIVLQADPDHTYESNNPISYEFTSPGRGPVRGNDQTHRDGLRIFRETYKTAGPYSTSPGDPQNQLQRNGGQLQRNGVPLTRHQVNP